MDVSRFLTQLGRTYPQLKHPLIPPPNSAPMPPDTDLLGHLTALRRDRLGWLSEMQRNHGDVVRVRFLNKTAHYIFHPDHAQHVLQKNNRNYDKKTRGFILLSEFLGDGLLTSDGDFWLRQRRIAQPAFHRKRLQQFGDMITQRTEDMIQRWQPNLDTDTTVDVAKEMMRLTLRIAGLALLSKDFEGDAQVVGHTLEVALDAFSRRVTRPFNLEKLLRTRKHRALEGALQDIDHLIYDLIRERRNAPSDQRFDDLLSMLMEARDEDTGEGMSDTQLRDEALTAFLAGHETTATGLAWTLLLLSRHPDIARRLRAELDDVLNGRTPTVDDLSNLPFTRQVIDESMRIYPPAWVVARRSIHPDTFGDYPIPADCYVIIGIHTIHRHPEFWDNPEGFDPDRFTPERVKDMHRFQYFPFGGGPRLCIGRSFALMEMHLVLATLLQHVRLDLVPGSVVKTQPLVTLRPSPGIPMTLHRVS